MLAQRHRVGDVAGDHEGGVPLAEVAQSIKVEVEHPARLTQVRFVDQHQTGPQASFVKRTRSRPTAAPRSTASHGSSATAGTNHRTRPSSWQHHYGAAFPFFQQAKAANDPDRILTPGQRIFG